MSIHKQIVLVLALGALLAACQTINIPEAYNFKPKEIKGNPYGCWTVVQYFAHKDSHVTDTIAGELICIDSDTLSLLVDDWHVRSIFSGDVFQADLYTHKNMSRTYNGLTLIYLIPNFIGSIAYAADYGSSFLALGIPVAVVGFVIGSIEGHSSQYKLQYPQKVSLDQLRLYARFPKGKPINVDFKQLYLKRSIK